MLRARFPVRCHSGCKRCAVMSQLRICQNRYMKQTGNCNRRFVKLWDGIPCACQVPRLALGPWRL
jgi:hypothetical protein